MVNFRKNRVGELLREVISDLVARRIKDPRVQGVTITEVRMAKDLKTANVYFGCLADGKPDVHKEGLDAASGFIRREIRREVNLKYIPHLSFFYDTAFDNFSRINSILKELKPLESEDDA
jgi:ribosome-binding factor A